MIRIAIVEDEPEVQAQLEGYIRKYEKESSDKFEISIFSDGDDIIDGYLAVYDIIFLDIQMRRMDGMTTAEKIRTMDKEVILIFITNMAHYAIRGYAVDAMDFILKPVPYFAFSQELQKAVSRMKKRPKAFITVPIESGMVRLNVTEVYYFESFGHRILIHTKEGEYSMSESLKNMEQQMIKYNFFRCNNCYLVNLAHVESVRQNIVTVGGYELQISRPKKKAFMDALADHIGGIAK